MTGRPVEPRASVLASVGSTLALCAGAAILLTIGLFAVSALLDDGQPAAPGPLSKVGPMLSERPPLLQPRKSVPASSSHAAPEKPSEPQTVRVQSGGSGRVQTFLVGRYPEDVADDQAESEAVSTPGADEPSPQPTLAEPRCAGLKSFDPRSRTYRGLDGTIRDCPARGAAAGSPLQ